MGAKMEWVDRSQGKENAIDGIFLASKNQGRGLVCIAVVQDYKEYPSVSRGISFGFV